MSWPFVDAHERARFASRVHVGKGDECWIWLGGLEPDGGYSRFRSTTLGVIAGHRWSAIAHLGALADPVVRHRCDVRRCVRPDHLCTGTQAQNIADTVRRGRWSSYARTGPRHWPALASRCDQRPGRATTTDRRAAAPPDPARVWPERPAARLD